MKKILLAYSGGLDTSVMLKWLIEKYDAEVVTFTGFLGQKKEIEGLEKKAKYSGAKKSYIMDLQKEFLENYVWKSLKAGALYEGEYPLACAIGRPLLAKKMVEIAEQENIDILAHGCTGKGNDQVRFEVGIRSLNPSLSIIAPVREWEFKTREEEIEYAIKHNIPISISSASPYSIDENIWGTAIECGVIEDPTMPPPEDAFQITKNLFDAIDSPELISIGFEQGIPVSLNGDYLDSISLVNKLNSLGGLHGIGRLDLIENRVVGIKSREIYEAPAAVILHAAHAQLEKLVFDKEVFRNKQSISNQVANLIYDGKWHSPLFNSLMAFVDETQQNVTGEISIKLYKGNLVIQSRKSLFSLYNKSLATYSAGYTFNQKDAAGFIKLYGLPFETYNIVNNQKLNGVKSDVVGG